MKESIPMQNLPPYLFARIEKKIDEAREKGLDIINLGIGDPDQPTPGTLLTAWPNPYMIRPTTSTPVQLA
jgi:LL-diaminopimelate aminotransferase apoenzyme (EC 2.6.1.83)